MKNHTPTPLEDEWIEVDFEDDRQIRENLRYDQDRDRDRDQYQDQYQYRDQ